jgi:hypothetical protein
MTEPISASKWSEAFATFGEDYQWWFYYGAPIDWAHVKMHGTPYEWHRTPYPHNGPALHESPPLTMSVWDPTNEEWVAIGGTQGLAE